MNDITLLDQIVDEIAAGSARPLVFDVWAEDTDSDPTPLHGIERPTVTP